MQQMHTIHNQPQIGTEIMDYNMPSELNFRNSDNPEEEAEWRSKLDDDMCIKQFSVRGKNVLSFEPKYRRNQFVRY